MLIFCLLDCDFFVFGFFFSFIGNRFEFSLNEFWFGLCSLLKFYCIIDLILSGKGSWFNGFKFEFVFLGWIFWVCVLVFFVFLNLSLCLLLGMCFYVFVLMFKFVIMFLCVLVQNELDLNLCILLFLILFFLFFYLVKIDKLF